MFNIKIFLKIVLLAILMQLLANRSFAGGVTVIPDSIAINGGAVVPLSKGQEFEISFYAYNYQYGSGDHMYLPVILIPSGHNPRYASTSDTQQWTYLLLTLSDGRPKAEESDRDIRIRFKVRAPERAGRYKLLYSMNPIFRKNPVRGAMGIRSIFEPSGFDRIQIRREVLSGRSFLTSLGEISVIGQDSIDARNRMHLYMQVNGQTPGIGQVSGGIADKPLRFSWELRGEYARQRRAINYRYKLWPSDTAWSEWSSELDVQYTFLQQGMYEFQVEARYKAEDEEITSFPARYEFFIRSPLIVKPSEDIIRKATTGSPPTPPSPPVDVNSVYSGSRALLVGVWQFDDATNLLSFGESRIKKDIDTLSAALIKNNFKVSTLFKSRVTKDDVMQAVEDLVRATRPNERIFVYFSTHGFADPLSSADVYLATSDCEVSKPRVKCIRLNDFETDIRRVMGLNARQILFAIDSCFSGLGIVSKSLPRTDLARLAAHQGAYMLTAGMADQKAQIDPQLNMSTFTHFLAKGLSGSANFIDDGVITMTELFLYVQYETARQTQSAQIPMMGRVFGQGEMLFVVQ